MALTDATVKTLEPKETNYKLSDAGGLYLYVSKTGGKLWRKKYRYEGKVSIGVQNFPLIGVQFFPLFA